MTSKYTLIILVELGMGNTLEALYALEYCLRQEVRACIVANKVNKAFVNYLKACYGEDVVFDTQHGLSCQYLLHGFTFEDDIKISFDYYFYIDGGYHSTRVLSETEQFLSVVKALFPGGSDHYTLTYLKGERSAKLDALNIEQKYVLYPGGSPANSARRWPHFKGLIAALGAAHVIMVGGKEDLDFSYAYVFPRWFTRIFPQMLMNQIRVWKLMKKTGLMRKYAHLENVENQSYAFFNAFNWGELVELFRSCKGFIGNDGGLMHLASAAGAKGVAIFGPSSVNKNKSYNPDIREIYQQYHCQPCQFGVGGINLTKYYINCPYQVKCLSTIQPDTILKAL